MITAEIGCVFMGLILYISGVLGQSEHICALKGSTVNLPCITKNNKANTRWYTVQWDGRHVMNTHNISEENHPTLTIKDVRERDEENYCCTENAEQSDDCWNNYIQLRVAELQVKVIPVTDEQKVTLMCGTSCPLTESPSAYIWYKNGEFLYEDWSLWYQQLVSSDKAVRYSCAVKGYEDLRAPEVSVDSVTSTCFSVTYAKGKTCSYKHTSVDKPCSITYPRELTVQKTSAGRTVMLTCNTSCPLNDSKMSYSWYNNGQEQPPFLSQSFFPELHASKSACAVKGNKDLISAEYCHHEAICWRVNCVNRRICALEGSSVNITCEYLHPSNKPPQYKHWYKLKNGRVEDAERMTEVVDRVRFNNNTKNQNILELKNLKKNDSAEYRFRLQQKSKTAIKSSLSGVRLTVTGLRVTFSPSADVTEGQKVTLTCSTSCPLTDDANYIWYLNTQLFTPPENQNKHLVLETVSIQHAGHYSCAVNTLKDIRSNEKTLTVHRKMEIWILAAAAGATAAFLSLIVLAVVWCIRKKTATQTPQTETSSNLQQHSASLYENTPAPPAQQEDLHYSRVYFSNNHPEPHYSNIWPSLHQEQDYVQYSTVKFR